jgi:tartrate dehydrogenase/decarboxylase/D-malate dehydrogenase
MSRVAVIAGDGIGQEVIPAGIDVVKKAAAQCGATVEFTDFPWGCDYYRSHGKMMADDAFERLQEFDAIYLGAIGDPSVPDHISVWQLILPIRQRFDQYVNLRPMRLVQGVTTPLANRGPRDIDMVCVRENSEGEYGGIGGRVHAGRPNESAQQLSVFTRHGIERIAR